MLILDYRVTYVCSRSVKRRLWWDVTDETSLQTWRGRLIKFDEWKRHLIKWRKRLIKLDEWKRHLIKWRKRLIKLNEWKRHLIKWRRRLIKLDESNVISSSRISASSHQTFRENRQFFYFLMSNLLQWYLMWGT